MAVSRSAMAPASSPRVLLQAPRSCLVLALLGSVKAALSNVATAVATSPSVLCS